MTAILKTLMTGTGVSFPQTVERRRKQVQWGFLRKINTVKVDNPGTTQEASRRYDVGILNDVSAGDSAGNRLHVPPGDAVGGVLNAGPNNA